MTIGAHGDWGARKSSVLKMTESAFQELFMLENEQNQAEGGVIKLSPIRLDVRCDE